MIAVTSIGAVTIAMFIRIAFLLFKTLDNIAIPCSVKAKGLAPPK
jgi:hypothetical protein